MTQQNAGWNQTAPSAQNPVDTMFNNALNGKALTENLNGNGSLKNYGFDYLTTVSTILVHQQVELIETLFGCEQSNTYIVSNCNYKHERFI